MHFALCYVPFFSISLDITTRRSHRARFEKCDAPRMFEKEEERERMHAAVSDELSVSRNASAAIRCRFQVHAWASSMPPIRYSRRRSRMGKTTLLPSVLSRLSRRSKEREREPPIFSYRILVCVHARRAINGKILESRSRNPDAGSQFSWVGFTTTLIGPFYPRFVVPSISSFTSPRFHSALFLSSDPSRPFY